jgi:hypothetical protein
VQEKDRAAGAFVADKDGHVANAVVSLFPLQEQDLTRIPRPQLPESAQPSRPGPDTPLVSDNLISFEPGVFKPRVSVLSGGEDCFIESRDGRVMKASVKIGEWNMGLGGVRTDFGALVKGMTAENMQQREVLKIVERSAPAAVAYIVVVQSGAHRVTGTNGAFRFEGLPPGKYRLDVWHESGRKDVREVMLEAGKPMKLVVELR